MKEEKNHVGRPTNEEKRKKYFKKIQKDILYIIIGMVIFGFLTKGLNIKVSSFHVIIATILVLIWFIKRRF